MLFRRYSAPLPPLLKYIVHQLYAGQTTEIVVLRSSSGRWRVSNLYKAFLRRKVLPWLADLILESRRSLLRRGGHGSILVTLCSKAHSVLVKPFWTRNSRFPCSCKSQQRQFAVHKIPDMHLKSLASLYDAGRPQVDLSYFLHASPLWLSTLLPCPHTTLLSPPAHPYLGFP